MKPILTKKRRLQIAAFFYHLTFNPRATFVEAQLDGMRSSMADMLRDLSMLRTLTEVSNDTTAYWTISLGCEREDDLRDGIYLETGVFCVVDHVMMMPGVKLTRWTAPFREWGMTNPRIEHEAAIHFTALESRFMAKMREYGMYAKGSHPDLPDYTL